MKKHLFFLGAIATIFFSSCKKAENPDDQNEEETITTVRLNFTDQSNQNTFTVEYSDPDGVGGNAPTIGTINLDSGKVYTVSIEFWNEAETPAENITTEIQTESDEHIVCYEAMNNLMVAFNITDQDANSLPIGLASEWTVTTYDDGEVKISLKHQPGVKDGTCTPGDTDVEVTFPVVVN
ncbi:MAG: type 1 periplasmic binding fold superfamily protein [Crocinitomicaceae bacterium]|nr:type 1 periplasmic binding fold superfamily protein [Crocinitomicaceae bacterium]